MNLEDTCDWYGCSLHGLSKTFDAKILCLAVIRKNKYLAFARCLCPFEQQLSTKVSEETYGITSVGNEVSAEMSRDEPVSYFSEIEIWSDKTVARMLNASFCICKRLFCNIRFTALQYWQFAVTNVIKNSLVQKSCFVSHQPGVTFCFMYKSTTFLKTCFRIGNQFVVWYDKRKPFVIVINTSSTWSEDIQDHSILAISVGYLKLDVSCLTLSIDYKQSSRVKQLQEEYFIMDSFVSSRSWDHKYCCLGSGFSSWS